MRRIWKREQIEAGLVRVRPLLDGPQPQSPPPPPPPSTPFRAEASDQAVARQLRLLRSLAAGLIHERSQQLQKLRPDLLKLVLGICRQLLGREITADPTVVEYSLRQALELLGNVAAVTVRLHPDDAVFLQERWNESPGDQPPGELRLVPDESLARGECRLESNRGEIDATWDTQLNLIHQALAADDWQQSALPAQAFSPSADDEAAPAVPPRET